MLRWVISRLPVKVTIPVLLSLPVAVVVMVLSLVAFIQGRSAASNLADQNIQQIHRRIEGHLTRLLATPPAINQLNKRMLATGELSFSDVDRNRKPVFETLNIFQTVSSVVIGKQTGEVMWVIRYPGESTYEYAVKRSPEAKMEEYSLGGGGSIAGQRLSEYDFNTTGRPWYRAAIAADGPTWGEVYVWVRNGKGETLGIPYVEPCRDGERRVLGVINCELTLADISAFLGRLAVGKTGKAFIMESDGNLVATSEGSDCMKDGFNRLPAVEASDPWIAEAASKLLKRLGSPLTIAKRHGAEIVIAGQPMRVVVSPYRNRRNLSWFIVTLVPETDFLAEVQAGQRRSILIGAIAVVGTIVLGAILSLLMLRPFLSLVDQLQKIGSGDIEHKLHLDQTPEFRQLSNEINAMTDGLRDRLRLRQSLAVAMDVQQNLLPDKAPVIEGLDVSGHSTYCDQTGGDYYDYLDVRGLSDTTVAIAVGDVMGHGVAAAMLMATARGILRSRCDEIGSLGKLLTHMNRHLVKDGTDTVRFMTMLLMTLDGRGRQMRWASAGHDPSVVYDPERDSFVELKGGGIPLGIHDDWEYEEYAFDDVRSGQVYMVATDGVWETSNVAGELFGKDRVRELIRAKARLSAAEINEQIRAEVTRFRGSGGLDDDITYVIVKVC